MKQNQTTKKSRQNQMKQNQTTKKSRQNQTKQNQTPKKSRQNKPPTAFDTHDIDKLHKKPQGVPNVPWKQLTAMSVKDRANMSEHCFLERSSRKYPVCYRGSSDLSCVGLQAAKQRAKLQHNGKIAQRAMDFEDQFKCNERGEWEEREARIFSRRQI
jgi:hypothetical protein